MSEAALEILATGPLSSLQDRGRIGQRRLGIPWAGALATEWRALANHLVGNAPEHAVIETFEGGLTLCAEGKDIRIAVVGDATIEWLNNHGDTTSLSAWRSHVLQPSETLRITRSGAARCVYVAVHGLNVNDHHGSASTYARAGLGGLNGDVLRVGDRLPVVATEATLAPLGLTPPQLEAALASMLPQTEGLSVHAVPGPQADAFDAAVVDRFFETEWSISTETDRMGARLDGPGLDHRDPTRRDIVSDAILPGAIQVPGNGKPIVMLADAATLGGYPKIATVASADLSALALARPGTGVRFMACEAEAAVAHTRERARFWQELYASITYVSQAPDRRQLLTSNLIDGVTSALDP